MPQAPSAQVDASTATRPCYRTGSGMASIIEAHRVEQRPFFGRIFFYNGDTCNEGRESQQKLTPSSGLFTSVQLRGNSRISCLIRVILEMSPAVPRYSSEFLGRP